MGLKATIDKGVLTAFKAIQDLNVPMTYKSMTGVTRNLDAGTSVSTSTDFALKYSVFAKFTVEENDKDPTTLTSVKILFPTSTLSPTPKVSDILTDGIRTWEVLKLLSVPGASLTILQVRSSK